MPEAAAFSLWLAAGGVAVIHTLLGPDHYLPFIMLARARRWSPGRTALVTALCGIGHVASSVVLGLVGVGLGVAVAGLERIESARGSLAAWALVAFGLAYGLWGVRKGVRRLGGIEPHTHTGLQEKRQTAFWSLFAIFVLGPCEPLIPLLVLPASRGRWDWVLITVLVFGVVTVATMIGMALLGAAGLRTLRLGWLERWSHALAGGVIAASGFAILFLGT